MTAFTADRATALPGPAWLRARRAAAAERFASSPLPISDDELWRYTPIKDLDLDAYAPAPASSGGWSGSSPFADVVHGRAGLVVLVDGRLATVELSDAAVSAGVTVAAAADGDEDPGLLEVPDRDALGDLHDAFVADVVTITVPRGAVVEQPVVVVQAASGAGVASFAHLVVEAGEASEITVLDHWTSDGAGAAFVSPVVELRSGAAANLRYVQVQDLGPDTWSTGHLLVRPGRDATTKVWLAALGGRYARLYVDAQLAEQAATAEIAGVYFGEDDQIHDFRSQQDHRATRTRSDFLLKGAVVDDAHAVYTGMIRVHEGAKSTESFLANRNLVLSDGAHVDSVPNLEIVNENDIKSCGHAAATGPVDEEHVFYLESRGVPTEAAQRLIVYGFFDDVVRGVPVPEVREPLRAAISQKLDKAGSAGREGAGDA
ncbi:MAG TPA: Fe-S cluster assembly protein SufD [Acidimicrobiales bacterium]|nr:Fe-S cluster assembly protein SufD [Acidimicrobiales bacterium]